VLGAGITDVSGIVNIADITDVADIATYIADIATDIADIATDIVDIATDIADIVNIADIVDRCGYCRSDITNIVVEISKCVKGIIEVSYNIAKLNSLILIFFIFGIYF
jgi:hypothetical protein